MRALAAEPFNYNLLFRWFVGLNLDDAVWDVTVFTKNRERLLDGDVARRFFEQVLAQARQEGLLSDEHFTVDGTLIHAWASLKSFRAKDTPAAPPDDPGNPTVNFHGERRSNETHASTTDPEARLYRKGKHREAQLYYQGHVLMENRHGLAVDGCLTPATGYGERAAALERPASRLRPGRLDDKRPAGRLADRRPPAGGRAGAPRRGRIRSAPSVGGSPAIDRLGLVPRTFTGRPEFWPRAGRRRSGVSS